MKLKESTGDMYNWITHTGAVIKGRCPHDCSYCYMKKFPQDALRFVEKELTMPIKDNGKVIFVSSGTDMFAETVPREWIVKTLQHCNQYDNNYLFQSKNPARFLEFIDQLPDNHILGTTIETNREYNISKAPSMRSRAIAMSKLSTDKVVMKMVTIEPIMKFDLEVFVRMLKRIQPDFINIGADTCNSNLPEPSIKEIEKLVQELEKFTEVKLKSNLARLLK